MLEISRRKKSALNEIYNLFIAQFGFYQRKQRDIALVLAQGLR